MWCAYNKQQYFLMEVTYRCGVPATNSNTFLWKSQILMWCAYNKQQYFLVEVTDIDVVCLQQTAILFLWKSHI